MAARRGTTRVCCDCNRARRLTRPTTAHRLTANHAHASSLALAAVVMVTAANAGLASRAQSAAGAADTPRSGRDRRRRGHEGTSMAVAVSPDGRTLAVDLQGSIWTIPVAGGAATRITDVFNDARQPAWSPDGAHHRVLRLSRRRLRSVGVAPDGTNQRKLTFGAFDDREPAWSHDGTRIAFSSDRGDPLGSNYNIWVLEVATGAVAAADDASMPRTRCRAGRRTMPTSPSSRPATASITSGRCRRPAAPSGRLPSSTGRVDAASWGPGGQVVLHALEGGSSRLELGGAAITGTENAFPFRPSWLSATEFFYTADGKIRRRAVGASRVHRRAVHRDAAGDAGALHARRPRSSTHARHSKVLGLVRPVISPDASKVAFAAVGDIWVMPVGGAAENLTKDRFLDTDPAWSPDGTKLVYSSDKGGALLQLWIRDLATGQDRQLTQAHHPAAGRDLVARRDADCVLRRRRHVAAGTGLGGRRRDRRGHADSRLAVLAGHADLVARWPARGGGDGVVLLHAASAKAPTRY